MEGNLRFKINWANLLVGRKLNIFALFYFAFEGNFPWGAYIWRGDLTEGFFALRVRNFTVAAYLWSLNKTFDLAERREL